MTVCLKCGVDALSPTYTGSGLCWSCDSAALKQQVSQFFAQNKPGAMIPLNVSSPAMARMAQTTAAQFKQMLQGGGGPTGSVGYMPSQGSGFFAPSPSLALRRVKYLPNTFGWRYWVMAPDGCLVSPVRDTRWEGAELRTYTWSRDDAVRGVAGIHALLAPEQWRLLQHSYVNGGAPSSDVTGLVERFGHYVLGEDGWRAEWVVIKELLAPTQAIADKLRAYYPDLVVHCDEEQPKETDHGHRKGHRDRAEGSPDVPAGPDDGAGSTDDASYGTTFAQHPYAYSRTFPNRVLPATGAGAGVVDLQHLPLNVATMMRPGLEHQGYTVTMPQPKQSWWQKFDWRCLWLYLAIYTLLSVFTPERPWYWQMVLGFSCMALAELLLNHVPARRR